jgi:hypothetical protein
MNLLKNENGLELGKVMENLLCLMVYLDYDEIFGLNILKMLEHDQKSFDEQVCELLLLKHE